MVFVLYLTEVFGARVTKKGINKSQTSQVKYGFIKGKFINLKAVGKPCYSDNILEAWTQVLLTKNTVDVFERLT